MIMRSLRHPIHSEQREPVIMLRFVLSFLLSIAFIFSASADEPEMKQVKANLVSAFPELSAATVKPGPVSGMYEIEFGAKVFYTTSDGKYLFMGDLVDMGTHTNLTEARRATIRMRLLDEVGEQNMIVMGPANPKRTLTVFTDVDCGYCAKFHLEVPTLNKQGVKVRYLFYPRTGLHSESYKRAVAVWCAADRVKAIGVAKAGGKLDMKTCTNPVEKHYRLGERLDVNGTPTIFLDDGKILPGYIPAPRLLSMLGIKDDSSGAAVR
jgi:thiol:disulfide interchange protein DsbC